MVSDDQSMSRRTFLKGTLAASLSVISARGVYSVLETLPATRPARDSAPSQRRRREQYLVEGLTVVTDNEVAVIIPPLYHEVITATLAIGQKAAVLVEAQVRLEQALRTVEARYPPAPVGLTIMVGWGLPYFRSYLPPALVNAHLPVDRAYSAARGRRQYAVLDTIQFPSDPSDVFLEANEVMFLLQSDDQAIIAAAEQALFEDQRSEAYVGDLLQLTSVRKGFIGRGFGTPSVGKQLALAAGVPGAELIPDQAQLLLGFTSTQREALAPDNLVSFETLPDVTDQWPHGYFVGGCAMHLSHLFEDLLLWYRSFDSPARVARMGSPRTRAAPDVVTLPNDVEQLSSLEQLKQDAATGTLGHNATLQQANRITEPDGITDHYGQHRPAGTPLSLRGDFNTLDNPFAWSADPEFDGWSPSPAAGLHFVAFTATSHQFHAMRLAMDGVLPDGTNLREPPYSIPDTANGINSVMRATHRQNYLIPPRTHRSFPLVELLPKVQRAFVTLGETGA